MKVIDLIDDVFIKDIIGKGFVVGDNNELVPLDKGMQLKAGQLVLLDDNSIVSINNTNGMSEELTNSDQVLIKNANSIINADQIKSSFHTYFINDKDASHDGVNYKNDMIDHSLSDEKYISSSIADYSIVNYDNDEMLARAGHDTNYQPEDEKQINFYGNEQFDGGFIPTVAAIITIDNITADDVINAAEAKTDIPVHGTVGADVKAGDTVTVTVGSQTYTTTVQTGNTWTVAVPGNVLVDNGSHDVQASVTTTNSAGNTATANAEHPYTVDTTIAATIAIDNITSDDVINAAEAKTDIPVHGTVGDDVKVGDTVTVT
ncbi:Ig-like domain-containing protein, partial [Photobacterium piscicola]|uniref:Ig-like domain-containing protein n=1 Tax=Photobacterium piscicola TaxID=1378299 RepID=UPI002E18E2FB|nr:Ig-like domain-containing protein [Photobacterium piscicola]